MPCGVLVGGRREAKEQAGAKHQQPEIGREAQGLGQW
jgi:hypothetical protein